MPTLTICRGLSGSGKSTWAREQNAIVVSRDDLRVAAFKSDGPEYYRRPDLRQCEEYITKVEHDAIKRGLAAGFDVISDNTNIEMRYVNAIAKIGYAAGVPVEVKVFDMPVREAIRRAEFRAIGGGRNVPAEAIRRQAERFKPTAGLPEPPMIIPYSGSPDKPIAFMVDIDGTLAHMRDHRGPYDWHSVGLDEPDEVICDIVNNLADGNKMYNVIVMSGRDEVCRTETELWLRGLVPFDYLFMRPKGDMRADNIVKHELFWDNVAPHFDVKFVLDDRDQVVSMWRSIGLTCLQVAPGEF